MSLLKNMYNIMYESSAGRIRWRSNMWAIIGSKWDKKRLQNSVGELIQDDHVLVKRRSTHCPCAPGSDFWYDGSKYSVPATECRKCQYHRPANRSFKFPRCTYQKPVSVVDVTVEALQQTGDLVQKAQDEAARMMGKK